MAASHTKAVRKVGELTTRMREEGVLAKRGGDKTKVTLDDNGQAKSREMTLDDLGISRNIAAAGVKLLALSPHVFNSPPVATEPEPRISRDWRGCVATHIRHAHPDGG